MAEHKLAWALRAAAEDESIRFRSQQATGVYEIGTVLARPNYEWELVKKPTVTHEYYILYETSEYSEFKECKKDHKWTMHITITDGKLKAEFR